VTPTTTTAAVTTTSTVVPEYPVTVVAGNGEVTIPELPAAIVSLSPTATEMLFEIGAGEQVVAVDSLSNYPAEAPLTDLSAFSPNVEAVAAYAPDLVIAHFDANDLLAGLDQLGIPTLLLPAAATLDDVWDQFAVLGAATGHPEEATAAIDRVRAGLDEAATDHPVEPGLSYYYELDPTAYYSVTSETFVGSVIGLLGMESIADAADPEGESLGYPQLSAEFIIAADPDLIILADTLCCDQDQAKLSVRPGWEQMNAVTSGGVVELNDDIASRWGPRIVELLEQIAEKASGVVPAG
jgi:iron complex transport system substrate-binding protein